MKKILVLLVVFLGFSLTNCDRSEKSELSNVTASIKPTGSPSLKGGEIQSNYRVVLDKEFGKLWKKLEKKARDKRSESGDISLVASAPVIPQDEVLAQLDEITAAEFVSNVAPAATNYLSSEYQINCSLAPSDAHIALAALLSSHLDALVEEGVLLEISASGGINAYTPADPGANTSRFLNCLVVGFAAVGVVVTTATIQNILVGLITKTLSRAAIKAAILAVFGAGAATGGSAWVVGACVTTGIASIVFATTVCCLILPASAE